MWSNTWSFATSAAVIGIGAVSVIGLGCWLYDKYNSAATTPTHKPIITMLPETHQQYDSTDMSTGKTMDGETFYSKETGQQQNYITDTGETGGESSKSLDDESHRQSYQPQPPRDIVIDTTCIINGSSLFLLSKLKSSQTDQERTQIIGNMSRVDDDLENRWWRSVWRKKEETIEAATQRWVKTQYEKEIAGSKVTATVSQHSAK